VVPTVHGFQEAAGQADRGVAGQRKLSALVLVPLVSVAALCGEHKKATASPYPSSTGPAALQQSRAASDRQSMPAGGTFVGLKRVGVAL
jgi:hypothetical protein